MLSNTVTKLNNSNAVNALSEFEQKNKNVYVLSNDKIKEGDWCLVDISKTTDKNNWKIKQFSKFEEGFRNYSDEWIFRDGYSTSLGGTFKKIIASNNKNLNLPYPKKHTKNLYICFL